MTEAETYNPRLFKIIDLYSQATGKTLGAKEPELGDLEDPPVIDAETWAALDEAFRAIVLPDNQPGVVYPYAKRIAKRNNYDNYSSQTNLDPQSVSIAMSRVAALAGTSDELIEFLETRLEVALDKGPIAAAMVDVAVASKKPPLLLKALDRLKAAMDGVLPAMASSRKQCRA